MSDTLESRRRPYAPPRSGPCSWIRSSSPALGRRSGTSTAAAGSRRPGTRPRTRSFALAAGLISLGVQPEDRVAIASGTRMEWILADLAVMCAGGATTTVYPTTQHEDVAYILGDSESKVVFAEDAVQVVQDARPPGRAARPHQRSS